MLSRRLSAVLLCAFALLTGGLGTPATAAPTPLYYLSLGDSLATGYQPGQGDTDTGYPDQLLPLLAERTPGLELVKLGCRGETSASMLKGGKCAYPEGSQLKAAVAFLAAHPGQVRYLTLDIGGNDVNQCLRAGSLDVKCLNANIKALSANLWTIITELRKAGGAGVSYTGMTYYNPVLASWLGGGSGQAVAQLSVPLVRGVNGFASTLYLLAGYRVADVERAYASGDFKTKTTVDGYGRLPLNVGRICLWTHMCARKDIHPNTEGYRQIARTFAATIP
ncbi:SGNH/GDSL hydrolase family protein [Actinocorallia sp. A-T 12471]|uniref:SGNH/GDSL hydrolase family protein n=1 Tax=Actinocorallia sp. A-T 12471 TaxID=3089813 RepID=UPI0029D0DC09|nr:SGNH/GDSL hydrolase family protein [Actinocorallia sp. A-T 12471]MDX6742087.1 SGNH/GDSL hydrolase family protein [Actinocorallia sp. A-T 12471]